MENNLPPLSEEKLDFLELHIRKFMEEAYEKIELPNGEALFHLWAYLNCMMLSIHQKDPERGIKSFMNRMNIDQNKIIQEEVPN